MTLLKRFRTKSIASSPTKRIRKTLDSIQLLVESVKGDFNLEKIYSSIGEKLLTIDISSLFAVYNKNRNVITVKHYFTTKENIDLLNKMFPETLLNKKIPVSHLNKYKLPLEKKQTIFCRHRLRDVAPKIPNLKKFISDLPELNSIIAPLILGGEVIGTLEVFSRELQETHSKLFENFTNTFVKSIANIILFQEIKKSEEHYRDLFENAGEGFIIFNTEQKKFVEANKRMFEISGYSVEELRQINYLTLFEPLARKKIEILIKNHLKNNPGPPQSIKNYETKIITKNKERKSVSFAVNQTIDKPEWFFIINDISERKKAEEEVRRLSEFNQRILDNAPVSIIALAKNGTIISVNNLAKKLMEKSGQAIIKKNFFDTKSIKKNKKLLNLYQTLLQKGEPFYYDNLSYVIEGSGKKLFLNVIAVPLFNKNKNVDGAISMALDNTEAILAKQKLENLNRDLEKKVTNRTLELDIINKKLSQVLDLKSKFISDASHELRTPLTIIRGNLDLAIREAQNAKCEVPEIFHLVTHEVEQIRLILTDLTMLTNVDAGNEQLLYEKTNLGHLIRAVGQSLKILADQKKIALIYKKKLKGVQIMGDEAKLEKLLLNIVRNAIKYTEPKGCVRTWVENDKNGVRIFVKDNGVGIPEKDLPYVFERFYRVDKARSSEEKGTGLGLSIAKWITEAHNGKISVESKLGEGSTFTIHLPYDYKKQGTANSLF